MQNLSDTKISKLTKSGKYADGGGLYLNINSSGSKSWIFRFMFYKRRREMGLGAYPAVSVPRARELALENRRLLSEKKDPIQERVILRSKSEMHSVTFKQASVETIEHMKGAWKGEAQAILWLQSLENHVFPSFGSLPASKVTREVVIHCLRKIWDDFPETARRVRLRVERILDFATVMGYRVGDNPAVWKGNLESAFAARRKNSVTHHPAMKRDDVPAFYASLAERSDFVSTALAFLILTAGRTGEVIAAEWAEIDLDKRLWTVPAVRMKSGREHLVPLSDPAMEILVRMKAAKMTLFVFSGRIYGRHISNMAMLNVMRRQIGPGAVPHGFRSTFKDWASECTDFPGEVSEMALAHAIENKVEAAYRRGTLFDKRRLLMEEWAAFCSSKITRSDVEICTNEHLDSPKVTKGHSV